MRPHTHTHADGCLSLIVQWGAEGWGGQLAVVNRLHDCVFVWQSGDGAKDRNKERSTSAFSTPSSTKKTATIPSIKSVSDCQAVSRCLQESLRRWRNRLNLLFFLFFHTPPNCCSPDGSRRGEAYRPVVRTKHSRPGSKVSTARLAESFTAGSNQ